MTVSGAPFLSAVCCRPASRLSLSSTTCRTAIRCRRPRLLRPRRSDRPASETDCRLETGSEPDVDSTRLHCRQSATQPPTPTVPTTNIVRPLTRRDPSPSPLLPRKTAPSLAPSTEHTFHTGHVTRCLWTRAQRVTVSEHTGPVWERPGGSSPVCGHPRRR